MSRYLTSRRLFLLLGSIIVLVVIAGLTMSRGGRTASWPEQIVMNVENTVSGWVYRPVSKLTAFFGGLHDLRQMYVENAELKHDMQNYQDLNAKLQDAEAEDNRLRQMLNFSQGAGKSLIRVPAHVVGREPSEWNSELTIDVGSSQGVQPDMAVVAPDGSLVGRVEKVASGSAKVDLITDTQVGDGVAAFADTSTVQPFGVVTGSTRNEGALDMTFWGTLVQLPANKLIGTEVVTSGLSDVFPRGIVIGQITKVQYGPHNTVQTAIVQPAANLDYLQDVFVVHTPKQAGQVQ
ncbi:rod shape-determining protein MreC [Alicyclobacillus fastidiosus]|uniref:Cell shape-determining protein MreC n=1 Tax=Alicyclobacillus fastidiosus TaxID=392011 RepID=A0ABY6ZP84_9BACL|nr:rod shape-determining protein MreC [Alicyclobacillus fastidiosus]WAH44257.1 rod shape-determining protein MreC [Alicyclobacillus fastidiosus]GMA60579.1 cell shape-determining protein MreC [Alicyclobacillus fastidiosus]